MRWLVLLVVLVAGRAEADTINPVIGDASWQGDPDGAEVDRIRAHLLFAVDLLQTARPALTDEQLRNRAEALDALAGYARRGEFPLRTSDLFAGKRPRFIDDRGVHCAVAFLVARTDPALARTINTTHEYDYVRDIDEPALIAWAARTGISIDELAIVQPRYGSPPNREGAREVLESKKAMVTLACAKETLFQAKVALHASGDKRGVMTVTTRSTDPFVRCFAKTASFKERGQRWTRDPKAYELDLTLDLVSPNALLATYLKSVGVPSCKTKATSVAVEITGTRVGLIVSSTTSPADPVADECFRSKLRRNLAYFENVPDLSASFERQLSR